MKIAYLYWNIILAPAHCKEAPADYLLMNDDCLDACFATLVEQHRNVWVVCHKGLRRAVAYLHSHYTFVKAAGGVITNGEDHRQLLIYREGHWDLPKGMVEPGETLRCTALREVKEETGIDNIAVQQLLLKTYHIYNRYGGWHLKQTSWYTMLTPIPYPIVPQTEEGITEGLWVDSHLRHSRLQQSYAMLRSVDNEFITSIHTTQ